MVRSSYHPVFEPAHSAAGSFEGLERSPVGLGKTGIIYRNDALGGGKPPMELCA
jgi:hypothetical protein